MSHYFFKLCVTLAWLLFAAGCGIDAPQTTGKLPRENTPPAVPTANQALNLEPSPATASGGSLADVPPTTTPDADRLDASEADASEADAGAQADVQVVHRLALLTPGGPLLCDVSLMIEGSQDAWGLQLRSRRAFSANPVAASRVWQILDQDGSGALWASEIAQAPQMLWAYDADEDRILFPAELESLRERLERSVPMASTPRREATRYAAMLLESPDDADRWDYLLSDLYAPRQSLGPASFAALPDLFARLDADVDGALTTRELAALATVAPHGELHVRFGAVDEGGGSRAAVEWNMASLQVELAEAGADRAIVRVGKTRLLLTAQEASGTPDNSPAAIPQPVESESDEAMEPPSIDVQVHDEYDALFAELDVNGDGRLGEREALQSSQRLVAFDANADGRLEPDEIPYWMVVTFVKGEPKDERSFYVPNRRENVVPGKGEGWFAHADFNGDGDVSRREFLGSRAQFDRLDVNADGFIDADEAQGSW